MARSRRIVVAGPWPVRTSVESGQGQDDVAQGALHRGVVAAGEVGAPDRAGEQHVAGDDRPVEPLAGGQPVGDDVEREHRRPLGVPGGVEHLEGQPRQLEALTVDDLDDPLRLAPRGPLPELGLEHRQGARVHRAERVVEAVAVVGVDVGRGLAPAHRRHRVDVVEVAVGEQHGGRPEPVLREDAAQGVLDPDARVDDEALLPRPGGQDVAVGAEGGGGEGDGEHVREPNRAACLHWAPLFVRRRRTTGLTKKQERARARRRWEKQQAREAQRAADRARLARVAAVVGVVVLVVGLLAVLGLTLGRDQGTPSAGSTPSPSGTTLAGCALPPASLGTGAQLTLPDKKEAEGKTYTATLTTNCGDIVLRLDGTKAPQAVASFLQLARTNYWQDSPCHRLTATAALKVLQCGDPTGTGGGDPGYGFGVENAPKDGVYPRGTLAMARTTDPKKGNGGQFFLVYGKTTLPDPDGYTVFGTVTSGLDIVDKVAAAGVAPNGKSPTDGAPAAPISILSVAVTEEKS